MWPDKTIWVTEYGITARSNPPNAQAKQFLIEATMFLANHPKVEAAFPFGTFAITPSWICLPSKRRVQAERTPAFHEFLLQALPRLETLGSGWRCQCSEPSA